MSQRGLTTEEHRELGGVLKEARRLLLEAGALTRGCYPGISRELFGVADELISPRAFLERKLIEAVGDEDWVREVYFGEFVGEEVEDA
jgi:hypothetical protein